MEEQAPKRSVYARTTLQGVVLALVLALGFAGGVTVGAAGTGKAFSNIPLLGDGLDATPDDSVNLDPFWKAWNVLDAKFVETHASSTLPKSDAKIWGAIQGLAQSYGDPYTVFMPPEEAKAFADDIAGNFEGVGMEIGVKDDLLTVIAPLKGTPAERAGIRAGDGILSINDAPTDGLSTDEAVKLIRGPKGTEVRFKILRDGAIIDITVVRDRIDVPTIDHSLDESSGVYTISFYSFTGNSADLFRNALTGFKNSGSDKLLIDLRGNPGGYLEAAVAIASNFLPDGTVVVTEDYKGKRENLVHRSSGKGTVGKNVKVAILINQGSASASEILAGALQDEGRATLVGERSFGKGSVQELVKVGGGSLKITVARWLTPSGRSISDGGLTPDIDAKRTPEDAAAGKDPQRERAMQFLTTGK